MRIPKACVQCRRAKRRCIRYVAEQRCAPCEQRRIFCEGARGQKFLTERRLIPQLYVTTGINSDVCPESPGSQVTGGTYLSRGTAIELVDLYLDKFHGVPHSIFHPATLRSLVRDGSLNKALLYALCAIGCKFSGNPDTRHQCTYLTAESKRLLQADISNICIENIQACILIAMLSVGHGDSAFEALFFRT